MKYKLGPYEFISKKAAWKQASDVLYRHKIDDLLEGSDLYFIVDLFLTIKNIRNKIRQNTIVGIKVCKAGRNKCFKVVTSKATLIRFSIYNTLENDICKDIPLHLNGESQDLYDIHLLIKSLKLAGRYAIKSQTIKFKAKHRHKYTKRELRYIQVDHVYPLTYAQIVYDYLDNYKGNWKDIRIERNKFYYLKQAKDFRIYHEKVAKLQLLTKKENLAQPNAKLDWDALIKKLLSID